MAALFTIETTQMSINRQIGQQKMVIHPAEYHLAIKRNDVQIHARTS